MSNLSEQRHLDLLDHSIEPPVEARHRIRLAPDIYLGAVERLLGKQAIGPEPHKYLAVAVICQALADCRPPAPKDKVAALHHRTAWRFIEGDSVTYWAAAFRLDVELIRRIARHCGSPPPPPERRPRAALPQRSTHA